MKRTAPHEKLDPEINQKISELSANQPQDNVPLELFHYTTPEGLIGIIESYKLWATNIRYLNDFTELKYTHNLLREIIGSSSRKGSQLQNDFLKQVIEELGYYDVIFDAYVFCLSEAGDQLSQWREYSSRGIGYSIGFKGAALKRSFGHRVEIILVKVIYDKSQQTRFIERIIIDTCKFLEDIEKRYPGRTRDNIIDCCDILMRALASYTVQFKHQAFSEEKEWRIVCIPFHDIKHDIKDDILFRSANKMIIPYIELKMGTDKLPIYSVFQGPQSELDLTRKALQTLFSKSQYHDILIRDSIVPLRF